MKELNLKDTRQDNAFRGKSCNGPLRSQLKIREEELNSVQLTGWLVSVL